MQRRGWTVLLMLGAALSSHSLSAAEDTAPTSDTFRPATSLGNPYFASSPEATEIETNALSSNTVSIQNLVANDEEAGSVSQVATDVGDLADSSTSSGSGLSVSGSSSNSSSSDSPPSEPASASDSGSFYNATAGYDCSCSDARKVSLMGASDYCLAPGARYSAKCGNQMLGDLGECPRIGAQPCSELGHVLTSDAECKLDEKDEVFKCVASQDDQDIQSGKKPKKESSSDGNPNVGDDNSATVVTTGSTSVLTVTALALLGGLGVIF